MIKLETNARSLDFQYDIWATEDDGAPKTQMNW